MRYISALIIAVIITAALFFGMQALIKNGETGVNEPPKGAVLDFVRLKQEERVEKKERKPRKPPKPKDPPPPMDQPQMQSANPNAAATASSFSADIQADVGLAGGLNLESGDGEYLPIVKVAAVYPRRALSRGIEGYVIVEFVVTKNGSVRNPVIVEAQPADIFNKAALDSALKYKYKPRVVDGQPVEVAGVQTRITFEISG